MRPTPTSNGPLSSSATTKRRASAFGSTDADEAATRTPPLLPLLLHAASTVAYGGGRPVNEVRAVSYSIVYARPETAPVGSFRLVARRPEHNTLHSSLTRFCRSCPSPSETFPSVRPSVSPTLARLRLAALHSYARSPSSSVAVASCMYNCSLNAFGASSTASRWFVAAAPAAAGA